MSNFETYQSQLLNIARAHPSRPAFKVPQDGSPDITWRTVTYSELVLDIENASRYWAHELSAQGCGRRSVIGLWLKGTSYSDYLTIWGLARAGFIPQLISLRLSSPAVVYEMLASTSAPVLIHDKSVSTLLSQSKSPVSLLVAVDVDSLQVAHLKLPNLWTPSNAQDIMLMYHTSGSTSGIPKVVPLTTRWFQSSIAKATQFSRNNLKSTRQMVSVLIGAFTHLGSFLALMDIIPSHGCLIIPHELPHRSSELKEMIQHAGLTDLNMFGSFLSKLLAEARQDASLLASLQQLTLLNYAGLPVDQGEETWARTQGLDIRNLFGSTEVGMVMVSSIGSEVGSLVLEPSTVSIYELVPLSSETDTGENEKLVEFVLLPESPDCPHESLRDPVSGKYHTGDLFVEIAPGKLVSKGRNDDWIKMERSLRCDTGSLEKNALETCGEDLIGAVVVCGAGRPSPVMFIEPKDSKAETSSLPKQVLQRIRPFHQRRYDHERIEIEHFILVKPAGSLPRTAKGSIQRKTVEAMFADEISRVYSSIQ